MSNTNIMFFGKPSRISHVVKSMRSMYKPDGKGNLVYKPNTENVQKYVNGWKFLNIQFRKANGLEPIDWNKVVNK